MCRFASNTAPTGGAEAIEIARFGWPVPAFRATPRRSRTFPNLSVFENFGIPCYRRTARADFLDRSRVMRMFQDQVGRLSIHIGSGAAPIHSLSGSNQHEIVFGPALTLALNDPTHGQGHSVPFERDRGVRRVVRGA
jgi:hypothetical protein